MLGIQLIASGFVVIPLATQAWLARRWMNRSVLEPDPLPTTGLPGLCVVLPVWNEAEVIEGKLDDIAAQDYPRDKLDLILIDSASTDETIMRAERWLDAHPDVFPPERLKIIRMRVRLGKSAAINRAIGFAPEDANVFLMTDADARLDQGAFERVGRWIAMPDIGAVCGRGTPFEAAGRENERAYRNWFDHLREAESRRDSTTVMEGSLAGYDLDLIRDHRIREDSNADDTQLGFIARQSGGRAIFDTSLRFREHTPTDGPEATQRKTRRAQGLIRHLWRTRSHWFRPRHGAWGTILGLNGLTHVIAPWVVTIGFTAGILHITGIVTDPVGILAATWLDRAMLLADASVLTLMGLGLLRIPFGPARLVWAYFTHMGMALKAQCMLLGGNSLHMWDQTREAREGFDRGS